ncbi:synaptic vesicle glycoprotein 2C [Drosophila subpulchrella]|uniref:synaptic vesicle glycoprotein 2C n=1 Tax=Drosophila subpulchrella TaxID=1486046 RepID=UPI0018A16BCF|nr:synaptic vesicle glycoprotein 2C [Drosophila subpulchrella]
MGESREPEPAESGDSKLPKIPEQQEDPPQKDAAADFETAIDAAGFGMFNIFLLMAAVPAAMSTVYETSTMSYILPSAECDLKLSLLDKGILNAITYAGMISSAVMWGYLADTKGRKKLLIVGYAADTLCVLGGALSQNRIQLMVFKYLGGFCMSGPFAVLMTYLTELHGRKHRQRIMMMVGIMFSIALLTLPGLAMLILPETWNLRIWNLTLTSWQVFVAITAVPSFLSFVIFFFFPESPKFLMSKGRNREAMAAFKFMYHLNSRKPKDSFPIKLLANEVIVPEKRHKKGEVVPADIKIPIESTETQDPECQDAKKSSLRSGLTQLRPLFTKPYLSLSLWVYLLNFCVLLGQNTFRLWLPQLFASINEYELLKEGQSDSTSICNILEFSVNRTESQLEAALRRDPNAECVVNITASSYSNNLIVAAAGLVAYMLAGFLVNLVGVKRIMTLGLFAAGCCSIGMYWSSSAVSTVAIASLFVTMGSISATSVISASVNLFPTSLRTMIVSLEMMFGRLGSLLGNIFFPALMGLGCVPPFFMISSFMLAGCLLAAFLPLKNKAALK